MEDHLLPMTETPAFKNRHGWLIAFGIFDLLIALMCVGAMLFIANLNRLAPQSANGTKVPHFAFFVVGGIYGFIAAVFIAGGVGSILQENWARILMLVVGWFWLVAGSLSTIVSLIMPTPQNAPDVPPAAKIGVSVFLILGMVLLPGILVLFYSSKSVRLTCTAGQMVTSSNGQTPVSMIIVFGLFLFAALGTACASIFLPVLAVFGVLLTGKIARVCLVVSAALYAGSAWLFWRRDRHGWMAVFALTLFFAISGLVTSWLVPPQTMLSALHISWASPSDLDSSSPFLRKNVQLVFITISQVLYLSLVWYTRRFFKQEFPIIADEDSV